jgi:hypothetical protein
MVKIMDIPDPRGRGSFWEAYRACAEENRVRPDRSAFYVNWARDFANFLPEKPFPKPKRGLGVKPSKFRYDFSFQELNPSP